MRTVVSLIGCMDVARKEMLQRKDSKTQFHSANLCHRNQAKFLDNSRIAEDRTMRSHSNSPS